MTTRGKRLLHLLLSVLAVLVLIPRAPALPPPSSFEATRLVKQLGSPNFPEREAATRALEVMGERALPALQKAARDDKDAEVRRRAAEIIKSSRGRDREKLFGTWRVVDTESEGHSIDGGRYETLYIFGDREVQYFVRTPRLRRLDGTYDVSGTDLTVSFHKGAVQRFIYRLERDTLRLCFHGSGGLRPDKLETRKGTDLFILTLTRVP